MNAFLDAPTDALPLEKATTLRYQLLISVLAPIVLLMLVSSMVSYYYAFNFANIAYDSALFDSALDISRQIRTANGQVRLDLPKAALDMLESDKGNRVFYMIRDAQGAFVAGEEELPLPPKSRDASIGKPIYYNGVFRESPVRIAAMYAVVPGAAQQDPVTISVAETLDQRRSLAYEVLASMLLPELILLVIVGALVWYGIERGLQPLTVLQQEIGRRSHRDLRSLPEQNAPEEVRALVHAMNDLLSRLSEALSTRQRFIADAAHQLRTPLAGLKTQTELALRQNKFEDVRHTLLQLNTATGNTTHLVNQLLSLARAEPGVNRSQALQVIDLNDLLRDITSEWVPRAIERNIDLGCERASTRAQVEGDPILIKEMLRNLLDNAIRYTQYGGRVTARIVVDEHIVTLIVEDNGPGIAPTERGRVFERFHRILGNSVEGCGLGLAIVREIAESHNAEIRLGFAAPGVGTVIEVRFPRVESTVAFAS